MTEAELQSAVIETARLFGWRVAHFRPALTGKGWRTPVEADGAGFPDLVLARRGRLIFAELKRQKGQIRVGQIAWGYALGDVAAAADNVLYAVWHPADWTSGYIEEVLR